MSKLVETIVSDGDRLLPELEAIDRDLHQHPELSMSDVRIARIVANYIGKLGYVTGAVLRNGD